MDREELKSWIEQVAPELPRPKDAMDWSRHIDLVAAQLTQVYYGSDDNLRSLDGIMETWTEFRGRVALVRQQDARDVRGMLAE